ncbi:sulfatase-like hydrolase/transferase [Draconibacterium orientale]|uniref:sulfatase-like hydrolase/transferase n=1 Tax=Draconibacterium orientale TaxID=1168034 RepID=UPI002ABDB067|nr:sulfatase-like hydrolase/transferase [Draconibacterium orientale]
MKNYICSLILILFVLSANAQQKPNILWITIEDSSPQFFGCYGNQDAHTPAIDKLASEGVRFTNAFSTGTVCSPSRSTIITGVRTFKAGTGNHRSNYPVPESIKGFPYYMQQQDYYVSNNSKTDYNVANAKDFIRQAWNESSGKAGWWNRKPGQPFFAIFNFNESHQSRTMTMPYEWYTENVWNQLDEDERIAEDGFEMPPIYRESSEMRKHFARVYNSISLTDKRIGELLDRLEADNLRDSTIIFFYADHGEGEPRGKTNGINYGYRVPFVVWFPEMYKDLSPWGTAGVVTDELISFEDLAPTLISMAGGEIPEHLEGRILMGKDRSETTDHLLLSADRSDNGIDMVRTITDGRYIYSRNYLPFIPQGRYIRYMYIGEIVQQMRSDYREGLLDSLQQSYFEPRPDEYLFDIENDHWETKNLVSDPEYKTVLERMRKQLDENLLNARDVMFLPEYEIGLISKNTTPYEYRLNKKEYPFEEIYSAASMSGKRGQSFAEKQVKLLNSENRIVRYWAIMGLHSQPAEILEASRQNIEKAMKDDYPLVRIGAAAIAYQQWNNGQAKEILAESCRSENMDIALFAINFLMYIDNKEPFIQTIRGVHDLPNRNYNVKAACMDFLGSLDLVPNNYEFRE